VIGNVLEPLGITVKPVEGGEERKVEDGKYRGVSLRWKNAYCTAEDIDNAEEIRRELDRSVLSSSQVSEVPAKINLRRQSPELVVLVTGILVARDGSKSGGGRKTCLALVNVGEVKPPKGSPCKEGFILKGGKCVSICGDGTYYKNGKCIPICGSGTILKGGKCVPVIKDTGTICQKGTELVNGSCVPKCKKGEIRKDGKCVKGSEPVKLTFGLAAGIGKLSFCPELAGDPIQVSLEGQLTIGSHFRVIGGIQTASMITGVNPATGAVTNKMDHGMLFMIGAEGFVSLARFGLKELNLGLRVSMLGNTDVQYPAVGGFIAYRLTEHFSLKAFAQKLFFQKIAANDLMADPESSSTWLFGAQVVFRF